MSRLREVDLGRAAIAASVASAAAADPEFAAYRAMLDSGTIVDPGSGRSEPLTPTGLDRASADILFYVAHALGASRTIETGFGLGTAAQAVLLATKGRPGRSHLSIDPYGAGGSSGTVLLRYLKRTYPREFRRLWKPSELALPKLVMQGRQFDFAFIDGNHHFDGVTIDFFYLDRLCRIGGFIVMDDVRFPAVEAVVDFIRKNRADYRVTEIDRFAVLEKLSRDSRHWSYFRPFRVPEREDWTPRSDHPG
jgi:hypothetical protein